MIWRYHGSALAIVRQGTLEWHLVGHGLEGTSEAPAMLAATDLSPRAGFHGRLCNCIVSMRAGGKVIRVASMAAEEEKGGNR